jgi:hypothetical protein
MQWGMLVVVMQWGMLVVVMQWGMLVLVVQETVSAGHAVGYVSGGRARDS